MAFLRSWDFVLQIFEGWSFICGQVRLTPPREKNAGTFGSSFSLFLRYEMSLDVW
jgi:hypothetical protein